MAELKRIKTAKSSAGAVSKEGEEVVWVGRRTVTSGVGRSVGKRNEGEVHLSGALRVVSAVRKTVRGGEEVGCELGCWARWWAGRFLLFFSVYFVLFFSISIF